MSSLLSPTTTRDKFGNFNNISGQNNQSNNYRFYSPVHDLITEGEQADILKLAAEEREALIMAVRQIQEQRRA